MDHVGRGALIEAYQRHEITRNTRSLLFCVVALLSRDALQVDLGRRFLGEALKTLGLHVKMTHDDPNSTLSAKIATPRSPKSGIDIRLGEYLSLLCCFVPTERKLRVR